MTRLRGRVRLSGTPIEGQIYAIYGTDLGEMYQVKWDEAESADAMLYDAHQLEAVSWAGHGDACETRATAMDWAEMRREIEHLRTQHGPEYGAKRAPGFCTRK